MAKKKILVVDDEVKISNQIKKILEHEGHLIELATNGKDGLSMAEKGDWDLIILDVMLPKLNGLEICRALRDDKIETPIIILTARDTIEDRLNATDAGADDYLSKPFAMKDLIIRVDSLLNAENIKKQNEPKVSKSLCDNEENLRLAKINKRIMDNVPVSIITIDREGNMTSANKFFKNLSKRGVFHNVFESKFFIRENLINDYRKLLNDGTVIKRDHCFERNSNGEDKYLKIMAVPLLDKKGNIEGAISMALDNTETVQLQKKLQIMNDELEKKVKERTKELAEANKEIEKILELKSMFVADVSHEMRTSLAIVRGSAELLSRGLIEPGEVFESYGQIFSEIERMSTMLSDMTLLSESETSAVRLDLHQIDLNEMIARACSSLKVMAKEKGISIKHRNSKKKIIAVVDPVQIEKLIMNFLQNAVRYNKENGQVLIWAGIKKGMIDINIKDTGIGIPKEYQQDIFERFYRVDKARSRNEGGSGLGLAICKWVAEIHGGSIDVDSVLGEGSLFIVKLPVVEKVKEENTY